MPLPFLLPLAIGLAGSSALGWAGHKLAGARRLNDIERDSYSTDRMQYDEDLATVQQLTGRKLSGREAAEAVLAYRKSPASKLGREYETAKRFTWGDSPDANLRVDLIDLASDVGTGFGMGGLAKAGVKSMGKFALESGLGNLLKRGLMESAESLGGQALSHGAVRAAEAMGAGPLIQTAAGMAGGFAGSMGAHAVPSALRARRGLRPAEIGSAVGTSLEEAEPEIPAPPVSAMSPSERAELDDALRMLGKHGPLGGKHLPAEGSNPFVPTSPSEARELRDVLPKPSLNRRYVSDTEQLYSAPGDFTDARSDYARELAKGRNSQPLTLDNLLDMGTREVTPRQAALEQAYDSLLSAEREAAERMRDPRAEYAEELASGAPSPGRNRAPAIIVDEELPDPKARDMDIREASVRKAIHQAQRDILTEKFKAGVSKLDSAEIRKEVAKRLGMREDDPLLKKNVSAATVRWYIPRIRQAVESSAQVITDPAEAAKIQDALPTLPASAGKPKGRKGKGKIKGNDAVIPTGLPEQNPEPPLPIVPAPREPDSGTIYPNTIPKTPVEEELEWRQGTAPGNVATTQERAEHITTKDLDGYWVKPGAGDPAGRLYAFEPDAPVREADRLAAANAERERAVKGMKEYSEKQKEMMEARASMRGRVTEAEKTAYDEWLERIAPEPKGTDIPISKAAGQSGIARGTAKSLVTPRQYANVRSMGRDVTPADLVYIQQMKQILNKAKKGKASDFVHLMENTLRDWMAMEMHGMAPADVAAVGNNYSLQKSIFNKIHELMPAGSRKLLTDLEQQHGLIKSIGPKAAAIAHSRALELEALKFQEEQNAYARKIKAEIQEAKRKEAQAAREAAGPQPEPVPKTISEEIQEILPPDTKSQGSGLPEVLAEQKPVVDSSVQVKPPLSPKETRQAEGILNDILPLKRYKDTRYRRSVIEAANAIRQRSMRLQDFPEDVRQAAELMLDRLSRQGRTKTKIVGVPLETAEPIPHTGARAPWANEENIEYGEAVRNLRSSLSDKEGSITIDRLGITAGDIPGMRLDPDSPAGRILHGVKSFLAEPLSNLPLGMQRAYRFWQDSIAVTKSDTFSIVRELRNYRNRAKLTDDRLRDLWIKGGDKTVDALRERYRRIVEPVLKEAEDLGLLRKGSADPFHLPRLYRLFEEKPGSYVPDESLWEPAASRLVADGYARDFNQAMEILGDMVNRRKGFLGQEHQAAAKLQRAMRRHDVPPELQAFLGKIDDPTYSIWKNASDWVKDVETLKLAKNLVDQGEGQWVSRTPRQGWVKWDDRWLSEWESATGLPISKNGALSGLWLHPDAAEPLISMHREASDLAKAWKVGMSLFKMAKVPLSMATQAINAIGNSWLVSLGGMNLMKQAEALPDALGEIIRSARGIDSEWVTLAKKNGVIGKHFLAEDLDILADGFWQTMRIKKGSAPLKVAIALREMVDRSPLAKPGEWYGMLEDAYRLMLFKHCVTEGVEPPLLSKASVFMKKVKMSPVEAAEHVNRTLFDYTRVPKAVDAMRNSFWPFITFPYKYAASVLRLGKENPIRLFNHVMGAVFLVNELKRNGYDINVSRLIPGMGMFFPDEHDREKGVLGRTLDVLKPGGPGVWPYELAAGRNVFTGGDLYYDDDTTAERVVKGAKHLAYQALPPIFGYTGRKLFQAWEDTYRGNEPVNRQKRDFQRELLEAVTGIRITPRTQEEWSNKQRAVYGRIRSELARYGAYLRSHPDATPGEIEERRQELVQNVEKLRQRWQELEQEKLGLPSR